MFASYKPVQAGILQSFQLLDKHIYNETKMLFHDVGGAFLFM
jgi:hypothetical protein